MTNPGSPIDASGSGAGRAVTASSSVEPQHPDEEPSHSWRPRLVATGLSIATVVVTIVLYPRAFWSADFVGGSATWLLRSAPILLPAGVVAAICLAWLPARPQCRIPLPMAVTLPCWAQVGIAMGAGVTAVLMAWRSNSFAYVRPSGVLPYSDAAAYHIGGLQLLHLHELDSFNARRPLNAGFYATRMGLLADDYWQSMLVQGALVGASAYLFLRAVARRWGGWGGAASAAIIFPFMIPHVSTTMSEPLGFALGAVAATLLLTAWLRPSFSDLVLGVFVLTVALNVRAGAYLVLPAIIVWAGFTDRFGGQSFRRSAITGAAVIAGLLINMPLGWAFSDGSSSINENFSYTLYGLAHGGTGWADAYRRFPPEEYASEGERAAAVYEAAFQQILDDPLDLVRGIADAYAYAFSDGLFGFVPYPWNWPVAVLMLVGLAVLGHRASRPWRGGIGAAVIGLGLSLPIIIEDAGPRVLAPTVPLLALPVAIGAAALVGRRWDVLLPDAHCDQRAYPRLSAERGAAVLATVVLLVGPFVAIGATSAAEREPLDCPIDELSVVARLGPKVPHLSFLGDDQERVSYGDVSAARYESSLLVTTHELTRLAPAVPGVSIALVLNEADSQQRMVYAAMPTELLGSRTRVVAFCGRISDDPAGKAVGLVYTDRLHEGEGP